MSVVPLAQMLHPELSIGQLVDIVARDYTTPEVQHEIGPFAPADITITLVVLGMLPDWAWDVPHFSLICCWDRVNSRPWPVRVVDGLLRFLVEQEILVVDHSFQPATIAFASAQVSRVLQSLAITNKLSKL